MKPWQRGRAGLSRKTGSRGEPKKKIYIFCEGKKTEKHYFDAFRVTSVEVYGLGANTLSVVEAAVEKKSELGKRDKSVFWCVFDRDSFTNERYSKAFELAKNNGIEIAYSNEAFELWYLLHFNYYDSAMSRALYKEKLSSCLGLEYEKNSGDMYQILLPKQSLAIKNAKKLLDSKANEDKHNSNPCTCVFKLVELLNLQK